MNVRGDGLGSAIDTAGSKAPSRAIAAAGVKIRAIANSRLERKPRHEPNHLSANLVHAPQAGDFSGPALGHRSRPEPRKTIAIDRRSFASIRGLQAPTRSTPVTSTVDFPVLRIGGAFPAYCDRKRRRVFSSSSRVTSRIQKAHVTSPGAARSASADHPASEEVQAELRRHAITATRSSRDSSAPSDSAFTRTTACVLSSWSICCTPLRLSIVS